MLITQQIENDAVSRIFASFFECFSLCLSRACLGKNVRFLCINGSKMPFFVGRAFVRRTKIPAPASLVGDRADAAGAKRPLVHANSFRKKYRDAFAKTGSGPKTVK